MAQIKEAPKVGSHPPSPPLLNALLSIYIYLLHVVTNSNKNPRKTHTINIILTTHSTQMAKCHNHCGNCLLC
jgi:hypothetical protein